LQNFFNTTALYSGRIRIEYTHRNMVCLYYTIIEREVKVMNFTAKLFTNTCLSIGLISMVTGCDNSESTKVAYSAIVHTQTIAIGDENCSNGGILLLTGIDKNSNNKLDPDEIDESQKICNGENGLIGPAGEKDDKSDTGETGKNALVTLTTEQPGTNCAYGGIKVESGLDSNSDGILESQEIENTEYVCSVNSSFSGWIGVERAGTINIKATYPQVALDKDGNTIAVWAEKHGSRWNIYSNHYIPGHGWSTPELIQESDNRSTDPTSPQIVMDVNGNAMAVWTESVDSKWQIWSSHYNGTSWTEEERIDASTDCAISPQIAISQNGKSAVALWIQYNEGDSNRKLYSRYYTAADGWDSVIHRIDTDDTFPVITAEIAMDAEGNACAIWSQRSILASYYSKDSGWGNITQLSNLGDKPQISMNGNGNAMAVWRRHYSGSQYFIEANQYVSGTGWMTTEHIEYNNGKLADDPQVTIDTDGNAIAIWQQFDGTHTSIYANRFGALFGWGTAELIETNNNGDASLAQIAIDGNGNAIAVWKQFNGSYNNIWSNRYYAESGWDIVPGPVAQKKDAASPQIALGTNGNAMAIWSQYDGLYGYNIFSNYYINP
jgi:hypothetical protein